MDNPNLKQLAQVLQSNQGAITKLMQSQDGKQLLQALQQQGGKQQLQQAASSAARGDTEALTKMIRQMMATPEGAALAERVRRSVGGGK